MNKNLLVFTIYEERVIMYAINLLYDLSCHYVYVIIDAYIFI